MKPTPKPVPVSAIVFLIFLFAQSVFAQQAPLPKTLLWRISGKGLAAPSYLYGTMHIQDKALFQFTDSVYEAIRRTNSFALELHPDTLAKAIFLEASKLSGVQGVQPSPRKARKGKRKTTLPEQRDTMPTIVDLYLYGIAFDQYKQILGLEVLKDQMDDETAMDPNDILYQEQGNIQGIEQMRSMYLDADISGLYTLIRNQDNEAERRKMDMRNTQMAARMASIMESTSLFTAVGAGHLAGDMGLISLLRQQGFTVEPVFSQVRRPVDSYTFTRPPNWQSFTDPDGYYRLSIPGIPQLYNHTENGLRMHGAIDLSRMRIYVSTSAPLPASKVKDIDSLLNAFSKGYSDGIKYTDIEQRSLVRPQGLYGKEMVLRDPESRIWFRFQFLVEQDRLFMLFICSARKPELQDAMSEQFIASFQPIAQERFRDGYWFRDSMTTLQFPRRPDKSDIASEDQTIRATQWGTADLETEAYYILVRSEANPTYVIHDDVQYFNSIMEGFAQNTNFTLYHKRDTSIGGFPARRFKAKQPGNKIYMEAMMVKYGSRVYAMLATAADSTVSALGIQRYFGSFRFLPLRPQGWSTQVSQEGGFSSWVPAPWHIDSSDKEMSNRASFYSYDSLSSTTYQLLCDTLSDYAWSASDTALLHASTREYVSEEQRLLHRRYFRAGNIPAVELVTTCADSSMVKKMRMFVKGNKRYTFFTFIPASWAEESNHRRFFESIKLPYDKDSLIVYSRTSTQLLQDLFHKDSLVSATAVAALSGAPFEPGDYPAILSQAMRQYTAGRDRYPNPVPQLFVQAKELATAFPESQADFIRVIERAYQDTSAGARQSAYDLLELLANMETEASITAIRKLLAGKRPVEGEPFSLLYTLRDSVSLTSKLYPDLLQYSGDSLLARGVFGLHQHMLEKQGITEAMVDQHRASVESGLGEVIQYVQKHEPEEDWWMGYRAISFLETLKDPRWTAWLEKFMALRQPDLRESAALALARKGQPVPQAIWDSIASVDRLRLDLYRSLEKMDKLKWFPKRYRNQSDFAIASLWESESFEDEMPTRIEPIGKEEMEIGKKKKTFYLYKVIYEYDGERAVYLGVSGPYSGKALMPDDEWSGIYWEDEYTRGLEKKHLKAYIDQFKEPPPGLEKIRY